MLGTGLGIDLKQLVEFAGQIRIVVFGLLAVSTAILNVHLAILIAGQNFPGTIWRGCNSG
jgi:hypothetical protein